MGLLDDAIREHLDLQRRRGADPAEVERAEREALGPVRRKGESGEYEEPEVQAPPAEAPAFDHEAPAYDHEAPALDHEAPAFDHEAPAYDHEAPGEYEPADSGDWAHDAGPETELHQLPDDFEDPAAGREPGPEAIEEFEARHLPPEPEPRAEPELEARPPRPASLSEPEPEPPAPPLQDWNAADDIGSAPEAFRTAPPSSRRPAEPPISDETTEFDVERAMRRDEREERHEPEEHERERPGSYADRERGPHGEPDEEVGEDVLEETPEFLQDTPDHDRLWFEQRPPRDFDFDG